MSRKGFLKVKFHSVQGIKGKECEVRASAVDASVSCRVSEKQAQHQEEFFLPIAEKIQLELRTQLQEIGFFELPMKKIYEFPTKKHVVTVNCITKNATTHEINPEVFGVLRLTIMYFEKHIAKLDVLIDRIELNGEKLQEEREVFVDCIVGNVSSQTTVKSGGEGLHYEWKEVLPFTLQSIPGKIELLIKQKTLQGAQELGKILLDPQQQKWLSEDTNKDERKYDTQGSKISLYLSKIFKIPENQ